MISTLVAGRSIAAEDSDLARLLPVWDHAVTVRTDVGYNDNVLLGAEPLQSSAFLSAALEALLWRLPIDGPEAQFLVSAEARCYAPSDFADYEQNLLTEAQVKRSFARDWQIALTADYLFQSLYVDETTVDAVSLQTTVGAAKVQGPGFVLAPALRRYLGESGWIETGGRAARFLYGSSVGDYWELGPSFRLGGAFTRRSEGSIGYQVLTRDYDNRPAVFLDGSPLPGSRLRITEHDFNLAFRS
ncbi:MAG TPA: hypothetical protein VNO52_09810, partial [Methylomirabilota bacterium]|nr:hypothetical protein [Methylomirabilota bacterium]